jgi:hypothetical protein
MFDGFGHTLSLGILLGALGNILPGTATLASLIWFLIQIYQSRTFKNWHHNWTAARHVRLLDKLRAEQRIVQARITALEVLRHAKVEAHDLVEGAKSDATALLAVQVAAAAAPVI